MAKRTLKEQQKKLMESYKVGHESRSIWYRIISVLSAITVFCTTYALILPALTQEDPTVGVKMARDFYYENEDVSIIFTVTGRAIFKDEHIEIDNPQAELVELEVIELEEGNIIYDAYAEHLENGIGSEDLAQILPLELKFSYLGNELDTKRCDITAQIQAKETFFTDEIGDVPQNTTTEEDHPMATPSYTSEPAMALTAIQGNGTNVFDAPTVYTTDVQEVSTLTVDVKGSTLALATSNTLNPTYTVQYYAYVTAIDNTGAGDYTHSIEVINTDGKGVPTNSTELDIMHYYLESAANGKYQFKTKTDLVPIYNSVAGLYYAGASNYPFLDRISTSSAPYELKQIWRLKPDAQVDSTNEEDWEIYGVDANLSEYFTNNSSAANSSKILIEEGDVIRLVYEESKDLSSVSQDLTMYDYDVSDGYLYTSNTLATAAGSDISSQSTSTAYMKTTDVLNTTGTTYYIDGYCGINSFVSGTGSVKFAFGDNKIGTGLDSQTWNGLKLNASGNTSKGVFGMVEGITLGNDYTPNFNSILKVPELFTNYNDHDSTYLANTKNVFSASTVAFYDGANNSGAINGTPANNATFTVHHNKESLSWKNLMGNTNRDLTVVKNENTYFTDDAYRVSGSKIYMPAQIGTDLNNAKITLELEFGDIRNAGNGNVILFADETETKQFCLSIESGRLRFWKNGNCVMDLPNGYDLAAYSTITIVQVVDTQKALYIYCDGDYLIRNTDSSGQFNVYNKRFYIGSDTSDHIVEYRSIRIHSGGNLAANTVCANARYNHTRSYLATKTNPGNAGGEVHSDTGGKNVIGGRDIVFNRIGDTYTLTSINNTNLTNSNVENLQYFNEHTKDGTKIISNNFWPMDFAGTFGGDGNDIKFGSSDLVENRKVFGRVLSTPANLPTSIDGADHNSYFGFKHKFDFTVDSDYCGPMNFFFYGDDDVWVFLADEAGNTQLVCDLGGVHDPVGEYVDLKDYIGQNGMAAEGNFSLYMFYLERGGSQSTAYMRMTVPMASVTLPNPEDTNVEMEEPPAVLEINNTLEITNTVNNIDAPQPFSYLIKLFDENGNALTGSYDYKRFTSITGVETDITGTQTFENQGEDGIAFEIPHGHKLVFYNLPAGTQYLITQITRNGFYTSYTINDNEVIKGNVDRYGNVTDEDTVLSGVLVDNKVVEIDFYNTNYAELPSTGFDGENSVLMYYVPFGIATVYMCAMPFINRTKKSKKGEIEPEQA